jgi:hypothetical protein
MKEDKPVLKDWVALARVCVECGTYMEKYSNCITGEYYKCSKCGAVES